MIFKRKEKKERKKVDKATIFGNVTAVVSGVLIAGIIGSVVIQNSPKDDKDFTNYVSLKSQSEIVRDIGVFEADYKCFMKGSDAKGNPTDILRFHKDKDTDIIICVDDDVADRWYKGYERSAEFLNGCFDVINDNYEWDVVRASELKNQKANIYIKNNYDEIGFSHGIGCKDGKIVDASIFVNTRKDDTIANKDVNIICLRNMMYSLGLNTMRDTQYYGKTIMCPNIYTNELKLLPYDARNLVASYADIDSYNRLQELKSFVKDKNYVANIEMQNTINIDDDMEM